MDEQNAARLTMAEKARVLRMEVVMDRASTDLTDAELGRTFGRARQETQDRRPRMRLAMLIASLATVTLGGSSGAFAQRIIEVQPNDLPHYEESVESAPRVYRYRSDSSAVVPVRPVSCGEFRYWNGERCVDARVIPPDIR
jgi:hypothetical protein